MNRDDAILKIKKCLALSKSSEPHEAAAALRQAQKLMQLYGVDSETIRLADIEEAAAKVSSRAHPVWDVRLANLVGDTFGCQMIVRRGYQRSDFVFVGVQASAQVAAYAYEVLARQCVHARSQHISEQSPRCKKATKTARGDAFAYAWVTAASQVLERFASTEKATELVEEYMTKTYPTLKPLSKTRDIASNMVHNGSLTAGYQAGKAAKLDRGVGTKKQPQLIGSAFDLT